ncbi:MULTISPECIES: N,N-dimethylformamidase beta subunit family domain-containing protein [Actinomadura]|uniref:N,N-dimethylformamidase beta subunit family domain-containing protein n=1 Tax=Actinomadura yumaensis TaxID=111807 RepID=A0ABW2CWI6_9ACTN|nr:N,N-dimethylformamidase beta subunit family domain-containing protein [Actinomadura sp. J1-007]MWK40158.1 N,N-dimethylformamidase [Actinomadura sp. J1-007]
MKIVGYADRLSAAPGDVVEFKISTTLPRYRARLVRLVRGGAPGRTHDMVERAVPSALDGAYPGREQTARAGSYARAALPEPVPADGFGAAAWIWPTLPGLDRPQAVLTASAPGGRSFSLALTRDGLALLGPGGDVLAATGTAPREREWCFAAAGYDPSTGEAVLLQAPRRGPAAETRVRLTAAVPAPAPVTEVLAAAAPGGGAPFNGKISHPALLTRAPSRDEAERLRAGGDPAAVLGDALLAAWDFSRDQHSVRVPGRGPRPVTATLVNMPTRAMTGPHWTGREMDFRAAPEEFSAIHFHDDDLADAGWDTDLRFTVPDDLPSGVYALHVRADGSGPDAEDGPEERTEDRIPFVVREAPEAGPAPVLLVLPTWTYLAYANWRTYVELREQRREMYGEDRAPDPVDEFLVEHPEYGRSLYDHHSDGSGVAYSSRLRPIPNMRPTYFTPTTKGLRHFAADLYIVHWLEALGVRYAVATDDDVHERGAELLNRHRVVLTGTHPEYLSGAMLDAYEEHTWSGGRLMYLGGNGFYWVTGRHAEAPHVVEIRRGNAGVRVWDSDPGEVHLSTTGEPGGLWRYRGRAPQRVAGVGFTAQGFDKASPYRRTDDSRDPAVAWVFDGVDADEFGAVGLGLGGAAGDEIDRADPLLGTPGDAWILAGSFGHSEKIVLAPDELTRKVSGAAAPAFGDPKVRSDVVLLRRPGGGAVFSVGSIAWMSAVAYDDCDNDTARITGNVLRAFIDKDDPVPPRDPR